MRSRLRASASCSRTSWPTRTAGPACAGEVLEELAVVGGVLLLGQARAQVQHPDQLALADERHGQLDAGRLHRRQRRRVELERLHVDRAAGALEVGEERVVGRDVDRGRLGLGRRRGRRGRGGVRLGRAAAEPADGAEGGGGEADRHGVGSILSGGRPGIVTRLVPGRGRSHSDTWAGCMVSAHGAGELGPQRLEVGLGAQAGAEALQRAGGVVLAPVEAPVDQRPGCAPRAGRKSAATASVEAAIARSEPLGDRREREAEQQHQSEVGRAERRGQRAVDERRG